MNADMEYLISYLEEEFASNPDVRIQPVFPSGTKRSPDLPQNYDSESNDIHMKSGVTVKTKTREYFFPLEWVSSRQFSEVHKLANHIRDTLIS